jgi:DNA-binding PadR family transcriptional regulator
LSSSRTPADPLSALDFHVLLVLADEDRYGYAIMKAVQEHSRGAVSPEIGSLYRVLSRLMSAGLVVERDPQAAEEQHPGRPRRYYRITRAGRVALRAEAERLRHALSLVDRVLPGARG